MKRPPPETGESWQDFADDIDELVYSVTPEGRFIFVNRRCRELLRYTDAELSALSLTDVVHPEHREAHAAAMERLLRGLAVTGFETAYMARGGAPVAVRGEIKPRVEQDRITAFRAVFRSVGDLRLAAQELRAANQQLEQWIAQAKRRTEQIAQIRQVGDLLESCESLEDFRKVILRALPAILPGHSGAFYEFNAEQNLIELVAAWGEAETGERIFPVEDCWALRRSRLHSHQDPTPSLLCRHLGDAQPPAYVCVPLMGYGKLVGLLHLRFAAAGASETGTLPNQTLAATLADRIAAPLAALKRRETTILNQSIRDPLTGLFNRNYLDDVLQRELSRAARRNRTVTLLLVDLDHFRSFNTRFGREAGDAMLGEISKLLAGKVRGEDLCCRYEGQKFVLILPEAPVAVARRRGEDLCTAAKALEATHRSRKLTGVTLSIGMAAFPDNASTPAGLLETAERTLARAKAAGGDRVVD
jgi:diguanylate cyclase (GGDEF)-like protein/PAS domain S-box-containing protein